MGKAKVNINQRERCLSLLLGGPLLWCSFSRGSLSGMALAIALLYRGISGHSCLYQVLNINKADEWEKPRSDAER